MRVSTLAVMALAALSLALADVETNRLLAQTAANGSWLDKKTPNWNQAGASIPRSPAPTSPSAEATHNWWTDATRPDGPVVLASSPEETEYFERCKSLVRPGTLPEDKLLQEAGWVLFGQAHVFGGLTVITGMAAVDGMCRPNQYQGFVFSGGQFAGSLSPTLMDSRTDGVLDTIQFVQDPAVAKGDSSSSAMIPAATFSRYKATDPLCCPSAASDVLYSLDDQDDEPLIIPQLPAQTSSNCDQ
ncbi:LppP/LprE family lipoprotein [Halochromatium sp.]